MGAMASSVWCTRVTCTSTESDQAGAPGENSRDHALPRLPQSWRDLRKPFTMEEYLSSRIPLRPRCGCMDCSTMVNGGMVSDVHRHIW